MAPGEGDVQTDHVHVHSPRCPYCHAPVERGEGLKVCASCHAFHHESCWQEHGDCASCSQRPALTNDGGKDAAVTPRRKSATWPYAIVAVLVGVLALEGLSWLVRGPTKTKRAPSSAPPAFDSPRPDVYSAPTPEPEVDDWPVERRLSAAYVDVLGARVRLPHGLRPTGQANTWSRGPVTLRAWRAPSPSAEELHRALAREHGAEPARTPRFAEEAIGGWRVRSGYWIDLQGSTYLAVVDDGHAEPLWWVQRSEGETSYYDLLLEMFETLESNAPSAARRAPETSPLVARDLNEGYSILASEAERVESESFVAVDLEAAIDRARLPDAEVISELRIAGAVLPSRTLYRVRGEWDNERAVRFVLAAVGFDEGLGVVVKISTPAVSLDGAAELLRLTSMVESMKPLSPERLWPDVSPIGEALPFGASGSIRPPRGWRRSLKHNDEKWVTWSGYGGDSIEVIVAGKDETILGGEKVLVQPLGNGRRVLTICAYAATPARRERVAAVARACAATLQLD